VVDFTLPPRICKKVTAIHGMRKTMKNLSMTASVMVKTQPRHIPRGSVQGKDLHSHSTLLGCDAF